MFNMALNINWPCSRTASYVFGGLGTPTKHTVFEFCLMRDYSILGIEFSIRLKGDHPGVYSTFRLMTYALELNLYDTRREQSK